VIRFLINPQRLSTLDHLYFAGDNRFGALGVSLSSDSYQPFQHGSLAQLADVQQLHTLIRQIESGETPPAHLARLVSPGATLGGAKPKALLNLEGAQWVVKFAEANDVVDRLSWRYPVVRLLLASPAVQSLRMAAQLFPVLRVPGVVDPKPRTQPGNIHWRDWLDKHYPGQ
jgi:hypothetical protein